MEMYNTLSVVKTILWNTSYCVTKTIQNKLMLLSDCAVCGKKNQASLKIKELVD